jgi:hypothetical protein
VQRQEIRGQVAASKNTEKSVKARRTCCTIRSIVETIDGRHWQTDGSRSDWHLCRNPVIRSGVLDRRVGRTEVERIDSDELAGYAEHPVDTQIADRALPPAPSEPH